MNGKRLLLRGAQGLGIALVVAPLCAFVYRQERQIGVEELQLLGGRVTINGEGDPVWLNMHGAALGCDQLQRVSRWEHLTSLVLTGGRVPADGLRAFAGHDRLRYLDLSFSECDPAALRTVGGMTGLREVRLRNCDWVDDGGLTCLRGLHRLKSLDLSGTSISDAGLRDLAALPALEDLTIDGCDTLTDDGLLQLKSFPALRTVRAVGISMDAATAEALQAGRPVSLFRIRIRGGQRDPVSERPPPH